MRSFLFIAFLIGYLTSLAITEEKTIILSKASTNYIEWIKDKDVIILDAYTINNTIVF